MNVLIAVALVIPWLLVAFGCWLGYQLMLQNGRILKRIEAQDEVLDEITDSVDELVSGPRQSLPQGLAAGEAAPPFELPDLDGAFVTLDSFHGRRVLLTFFSPECRYCIQMAPRVAALAVDGAERRPVPVLIMTAGGAEKARAFMGEHGIRCPVLLVEEGMTVLHAYRATETPMAYLVDEEGNLASEIAVGADAVLELAEPRPAVGFQGHADGSAGSVTGNGHAAAERARGKARRALTESRINRKGLKPGTPAPALHLPRLDGGELSLSEYRGRRVLLVFSDPNCEPCTTLAPKLEEFHRKFPEPAVVMIGRGDPQENRAKVAEHKLTFPVVLQEQWEISRLYAKFRVPMAYLIDEQGVIASECAVGWEGVLALARSAGARGKRRGLAVVTWLGSEMLDKP